MKETKKNLGNQSDLRNVLLLRMEEVRKEREKAEQKTTLKEVEATVKGKELILENMCD